MSAQSIYRFDQFELEPPARELRENGRQVSIEPKALDLLIHLVRHRDRVVSKQELLDTIWPEAFVSDASLTSCVRRLRTSLGAASKGLVKSYYGRGYRFIGECQATEEPRRQHPSPDAQPAPLEPAGRQRPAFVGRAAEIGTLHTAMREATTGSGTIVLLAGDQGVGKTRTVEFFLSTLDRENLEVLTANCVEGEGAPAFWPWTQIVRSCVGSTAGSTAGSADGAGAGAGAGTGAGAGAGTVSARSVALEHGELLSLLPPLAIRAGRETPIQDPAEARFRLFDGVISLLHRLAEQKPVVVVLEDVHLADEASLHLLQFAAREVTKSPILLVATYRTMEEENPTLRSAIATIETLPEHRLLRMKPLTRSDIGKLVEAMLGDGVHPDVLDRIHRESEGNPFFVEHLVRHLIDHGLEPTTEALPEWEDLAIPQGVQVVIERRLRRLSPRSRRLLEIAAVVGRVFDLPLLSHVRAVETGQPLRQAIEDTTAELEETIRLRIVEPAEGQDNRYQFIHAMFRETIYRDLGIAERSRRHRRVGEALLADPRAHPATRTTELANHFYRGAIAGCGQEASHYCREAAESALEQFAYETAARFYERALEAMQLVEEHDLRLEGEVSADLAEAHWRAGQMKPFRRAAERSAEIARRLGDPELLARAGLSFGRTISINADQGLDDTFTRILEEANATLPDKDSALRARTLSRLGWAYYYQRRPIGLREQLSRDAVAMATRLAEPDTLLPVLTESHTAMNHPLRHEERRAIANDLIRLAEARSAPEYLASGYELRAWDSLERGEIDAADRDMERFGELAEQLRLPYFRWVQQIWLSMRTMLEGRFDEAARFQNRSLEIGRAIEPDIAEVSYRTQYITLRLMQSHFDSVEDDLKLASRLYPDVPMAQLVLAYCHTQQGRLDEAASAVAPLIGVPVGEISVDTSLLPACLFLAEIVCVLEERDAAAQLYEEVLPFAPTHAILGSHAACYGGSMSRPLGILAMATKAWDAAERHLAHSLELHRRANARPFISHNLYDQGRMLRRRGRRSDRKKAEACFDEARALADQLQMVGLVRLVEEARRD